jgi:hypothetical protein
MNRSSGDFELAKGEFKNYKTEECKKLISPRYQNYLDNGYICARYIGKITYITEIFSLF